MLLLDIHGSDLGSSTSKSMSTSTQSCPLIKLLNHSEGSDSSYPEQDQHHCVIISKCQRPLSEASQRFKHTWLDYFVLQSYVKL